MGMMPPPPMGGSGQGPQGGPPPPPGAPSLANVPPGAPPPMGGADQAGGALPKLVFQIDTSLQTLARALPPDMSMKLDAIRETLREIVAEALSGGGQPESPEAQGGPY